MPKKTVPLGAGRQAVGESVRFKPIQEPWYEFQCEDGTILRLKIVVSEVIRLDEHFTDEGDPVYVVRSSNILQSDVPEHLKRGAGGNGGGKIQ